MPESPRTLSEESTQVLAGMRLAVRAAAFNVEGSSRGAVTASVAVPDGFFASRNDGAMTATVLLNPDEARQIAAWLTKAADTADEVGPPLSIA